MDFIYFYNTFQYLVFDLRFYDLFFLDCCVVLFSFFGIFYLHNNLIVFFMCLELVLVSFSFMFIISSYWFFGSSGLIFGYLILIVAGVESVIGLSILTIYFFVERNIFVEYMSRLKG